MTTAASAVSVPHDGGTEVCRITIQGPIGRADLAVPASTPLSVLMPVLLRHVTDDPEERGCRGCSRSWARSRWTSTPPR